MQAAAQPLTPPGPRPAAGTPASLPKQLVAELKHVPATVRLEQPFTVHFTLTNNTAQAMGPLTIGVPHFSTSGGLGWVAHAACMHRCARLLTSTVWLCGTYCASHHRTIAQAPCPPSHWALSAGHPNTRPIRQPVSRLVSSSVCCQSLHWATPQ
jgi:hypothetical protein